jgi:hypothetical protein
MLVKKCNLLVIAKSVATKQSGLSVGNNEIATLPLVARNNHEIFFSAACQDYF